MRYFSCWLSEAEACFASVPLCSANGCKKGVGGKVQNRPYLLSKSSVSFCKKIRTISFNHLNLFILQIILHFFQVYALAENHLRAFNHRRVEFHFWSFAFSKYSIPFRNKRPIFPDSITTYSQLGAVVFNFIHRPFFIRRINNDTFRGNKFRQFRHRDM